MPAKPKGGGENTKKAAGNAKKAEAAAAKQQAADAKSAAAESAEWSKGAKSSAKKDAAADKAAEAARKKAEKAALLAEEEASLPSKPKGNSKTATKKGAAPSSRGTLDLGALEGEKAEPARKQGALNATGIDNALDALSLANNTGKGEKVETHPERRFKAAYGAFEERRLEEMKDEKGLRRQQKVDRIRKEFEKHPDNPFNQALVGGHDMTKEEMRELREGVREAKEARLGGGPL